MCVRGKRLALLVAIAVVFLAIPSLATADGDDPPPPPTIGGDTNSGSIVGETGCPPGCGETPENYNEPSNPGDREVSSQPVRSLVSNGPWCGNEEGDKDVYCATICHDDMLVVEWVPELRAWVESQLVIVGNNDFDMSQDPPVCAYLAENPGCEELIIQNGEVFCTGSYSVTASVRVPCLQVLRDPYPRTIVSYPTLFWIQGPMSVIGSGSSREWCSFRVRNYELQLSWQMLPTPAPHWDFNERPGAESPIAAGMTVAHTWETSSFGLPENGPSLRGEMELPAYQVTVTTAWQLLYRSSWEELMRAGRIDISSCAADDDECWELYYLCDLANGTHPEGDACFNWVWRNRGSGGWLPIDLRNYGYPTSYYISIYAGDATMPPPGIPLVPLEERLCTVPVPVIESVGLVGSPGYAP